MYTTGSTVVSSETSLNLFLPPCSFILLLLEVTLHLNVGNQVLDRLGSSHQYTFNLESLSFHPWFFILHKATFKGCRDGEKDVYKSVRQGNVFV